MIAKMIKYDIVLYSGEHERFLDRLQDLGLVDVTVAGWEPSESDMKLISEVDSRGKAVEALRAKCAEKDFKAGTPYSNGDEAYAAYVEASSRATALKAEIARLRKASEDLAPWGEFSAERVSKLAGEGIVLRYFTCYSNVFKANIGDWSERYAIETIADTGHSVYFVVVSRPGDEIAIDAEEQKAPTMNYLEAAEAAEAAERELETVESTIARCAATVDAIASSTDRLKDQLELTRVVRSNEKAADGKLVVMEGWAEADTVAQVDALLDETPYLIYFKRKPTPEDDVPVKLKNHWFARVFELVGDMYARPKYGTLDLTPFFAPFYMLFFGICLNDAGYGLVLLLLGLVMYRKSKGGMMRQASWFAILCAISTMAVGLICGSFFGISLSESFPSIPFYDFQGKFFSMAMAIGIVQILLGMLLKVITTSVTLGFRYSFGTLGWFLVLLAVCIAGGLPMLNSAWVIPFFTTSSPAFYVVIGIGLVLMLLLNTPGRNPLVNFGSGLWDTYNNITGILSDVLSYIRLFAIGLSGGILATVFNSLADGLSPDIPVVKWIVMAIILLIGHGINLFMSAISSFVHPMRLTFVEFYKNAGFEIAAHSFNPLRKLSKSEK